MAHHHQGRFDQLHGTLGHSSVQQLLEPAGSPFPAEEELAPEADEPPDEEAYRFRRPAGPPLCRLQDQNKFARVVPAHVDRKRSLLSQAFAPTPEPSVREDVKPVRPPPQLLHQMSNVSLPSYTSAASTADLTSDGGFTSPARTNTPSPPPPGSNYAVTLDPMVKTETLSNVLGFGRNESVLPMPLGQPGLVPNAGDGLADRADGGGRKRCIKFACDRKALEEGSDTPKAVSRPLAPATKVDQNEAAPKRPCALRFACPFKAAAEPSKHAALTTAVPDPAKINPPTNTTVPPRPASDSGLFLSRSPNDETPRRSASGDALASLVAGIVCFKEPKFYEFASSLDEEEDWMNPPLVPGRRLTVDDTLEKEKTIRRLGEEVEEEEALLHDEERDDGAESEESDVPDNDDDNDDDDEDEDDFVSDDGAESDDEGGFASSDDDDDSDADSEFSFWTHRGRAAEQVGRSGTLWSRQPPRQSVDSITGAVSPLTVTAKSPMPRRRRRRPVVAMGPGTPPLPDSTDFVCGTLDEDRPIEEAYASCLAQRKRSSKPLVPQDIDPSFPTTDSEEDESEDEWHAKKHKAGKQHMGRQGDTHTAAAVKQVSGQTETQKPRSSFRRTGMGRSPPPPPSRRGTDMSPRRRRSPHPGRRMAIEAPSQDSSTAASPGDVNGVHMLPLMAPDLTRTKSLPHAPNPIYAAVCRATGVNAGSRTTSPSRRRNRRGVMHRRGAVDIVCGLEKKRQRRREKAWAKYCQRVAKGKERKPLRGEGAERMRELGLEMAGRNRVCCLERQRAQFVLSI